MGNIRRRLKVLLMWSYRHQKARRRKCGTEFDKEGNFNLGPFAEDAIVELEARTTDELRSRPTLVSLPTDDIVIYVYEWFRVKGTVRDRDTGEPFVDFKFINRGSPELDITDENGQFHVEICHDRSNLSVGIRASGFFLLVKSIYKY